MSTDKFPVEGLPNGYICESGNVIGGTSGENVISQTGCDWWNNSTLPYAYTVDAISTVEAEVRQNAGRGGNVVVGIRPGVSRKNWNPILTWKAGNGKVSYIASRRNSSVRVDLSGKMQRAQ
jgi:hypothetical protein